MAQVKIKIEGLKEMQRALNIAPRKIAPHLVRMLNNIQQTIQGQAVQNAPFRKGGLKGSFARGQRFATLSSLRAIVRPAISYAIFVHEGTAPHYIFPKDANGFLWWEGARHPVRQVFHPGTKPNPFLFDAVGDVRPMLERIYERTLERIANELKG